VINATLHEFIFNYENDTQLQAAITYLLDNPEPINE
jgi:hypothetical protein